MSVCAILTCAGNGSRCGLGYNKMLFDTGEGIPLFSIALHTLLSHPDIDKIIVTVGSEDLQVISKFISTLGTTSVIISEGGATRTQSIRKALKALDADCDIVLIHDGARPFVTSHIISEAINLAKDFGAVTAAVPLVDTIKEVNGDGLVLSTPDRACFLSIQTPQAFKTKLLLSAYSNFSGVASDDCGVVESVGIKVKTFLGSPCNIKITNPCDLEHFTPKNHTIGIGFDTHKLVCNRPLVLGGVTIPYHLGLLGHSDADVLTHAVMDALLSAAGLRDIGNIFPDNDPKYKGISSLILLEKVASKLRDGHFRVRNISAVILAEKPKLSPFIYAMRECLAKTLAIDISKINISATTTEGIGLVGREEGISSRASAICDKENLQ